MSPSPTGNIWLRLEPPFFLEDTLKSNGLDSHAIEVASFADDEIAAKVNASLRSSIERYVENKSSSNG